ncbi:MAG: hypothetical protein RTU92_10270 [Candidatus Thorarchaeota archaeon]
MSRVRNLIVRICSSRHGPAIVTIDEGEPAPVDVPYWKRKGLLYEFPKYFIHGILYQVLVLYAIINLLVPFILLTFLGMVGLVVMMGLIFFVFGILNFFIGQLLWDIKGRKNIWSFIGHGVVLWVCLIISNIPYMVDLTLITPGLMFHPEIGVSIQLWYTLTFVGYSFWYGYVGKMVASWFRDTDFKLPRRIYRHSQETVPGECPKCNALYLYPQFAILPNGNVECPNCQEVFFLERREYSVHADSQERES